MLSHQALPHPPGGVALLSRRRHIRQQPTIHNGHPRIDRRPRPRRVLLPRRRHRILQRLPHRAAVHLVPGRELPDRQPPPRRWSRRIASNSSTQHRILTDPPRRRHRHGRSETWVGPTFATTHRPPPDRSSRSRRGRNPRRQRRQVGPGQVTTPRGRDRGRGTAGRDCTAGSDVQLGRPRAQAVRQPDVAPSTRRATQGQPPARPASPLRDGAGGLGVPCNLRCLRCLRRQQGLPQRNGYGPLWPAAGWFAWSPPSGVHPAPAPSRGAKSDNQGQSSTTEFTSQTVRESDSHQSSHLRAARPRLSHTEHFYLGPCRDSRRADCPPEPVQGLVD